MESSSAVREVLTRFAPRGRLLFRISTLKPSSNGSMSEHNETLDKIRLAVVKAHEMLDKAQEGEVPLELTRASISDAIQLIAAAEQRDSKDVQRCAGEES
jgi:hypothetical protein